METAALHIACAACGAVNRVPAARAGDDPACGHCHRPLLDGHPMELTDGNFDAVARGTDLPLLVDFWAPWCGPCRQMAPQFEQAAQRLKGRVRLAKVNTDENPALAARFGIRSIPTLVRLERGRETGRDSGALPAARIVALAESR
ncbi:MAG: thioredoxin TrxC [Aquabacterium sp.]|jgi:thioredoxin 2|nr:thioredoxin TrxC [Aquabacterium sp.]